VHVASDNVPSQPDLSEALTPLVVKTSDNAGAITSPEALEVLLQTAKRAGEFAASAKAASTRRAYQSDLADFVRWTDSMGISALPAEPQTLALYLTQLAQRAKTSTIRRRLAAIKWAHDERGLHSPTTHPKVKEVVAGISRVLGTAPRKKTALTTELLRQSLETLSTGTRGVRDRALLLLGFSGAFRRSELAALDVADLRMTRRGLAVMLRRSKTDQAGEGREVAIPTISPASLCAVTAIKAWLEVARIVDGPIFRRVVAGRPTSQRISDKAIALLVQRVAKRAGIEGDFAAHSMRAGFITSAAERGVADHDIRRVTGHKSERVLDGYKRRANLFDDPALTSVMRER